MRYRIAKRTVLRMIESAGVREIDGETPAAKVFHILCDLSAVAQGLPYWDQARVYVALLEHFETLGINPPDIAEDLIFDTYTADIAQFAEEPARSTPGTPRSDPVVDTLASDEDEAESTNTITIKPGRARGRRRSS